MTTRKTFFVSYAQARDRACDLHDFSLLSRLSPVERSFRRHVLPKIVKLWKNHGDQTLATGLTYYLMSLQAADYSREDVMELVDTVYSMAQWH